MWEIPAVAAAIAAQYGPTSCVTGSSTVAELYGLSEMPLCFCGERSVAQTTYPPEFRCGKCFAQPRVTAADLLASMLGPMEAYTQVNTRREMTMGAKSSWLAYGTYLATGGTQQYQEDFLCYLDRPENKLASHNQQIATQRIAMEQYGHFSDQWDCVKAV